MNGGRRLEDRSASGVQLLDYARLRPGRGFKPIRATLYYFQRLITLRFARRAITKLISTVINFQHARPAVIDEHHNDVVTRLLSVGIVRVPSPLSDHELDEIGSFLESDRFIFRDGKTAPISARPAAATIADLPLATVLRCPHVLDVANRPELVSIASKYIGCLPTISTIGIRWSFPGPLVQAGTQEFHRDPDDWRFVKFFVYLTDVDGDCGPHHYVFGSHLQRPPLFARTSSRAEIENRYGMERVTAITGRRGTAFFAETAGIHAGPVPATKPRLMLEIGYSVLPVFALRYMPLQDLRATMYDKYMNRLLVR